MKIKTIFLSTIILLKTATQGSVVSDNTFSKRQTAEKFKYTIQCGDGDSQNICNSVEEVTKKIANDLSNTLGMYNK